MSEEGDGFRLAATRQNAGSALNGGTPRPPLYPRPRPAVFAVTLPGTSGTGPSVPASAEEPPPPRVAGFTGTAKPPGPTTCADVIVVFGNDNEESRSHRAGVCTLFCAAATPGRSASVRTNTQRIKLPRNRNMPVRLKPDTTPLLFETSTPSVRSIGGPAAGRGQKRIPTPNSNSQLPNAPGSWELDLGS